MMSSIPAGFDQAALTSSRLCRREFLGTCCDLGLRCGAEERETGRFFGRIWVEDEEGTVVRFQRNVHQQSEPTRRPIIFPFRQLAMKCAAGSLAPARGVHRRHAAQRGRARDELQGADEYLGLFAEAADAESDRESDGKSKSAQDQSDNSTDVSPLQPKRNGSRRPTAERAGPADAGGAWLRSERFRQEPSSR